MKTVNPSATLLRSYRGRRLAIPILRQRPTDKHQRQTISGSQLRLRSDSDPPEMLDAELVFRNGFGTVGVDRTRQEQPLEWRLGTYRTPGTVIMLAVGFAALVAIVAATFWLSARAQMHSREVVAIRAIRVAAVELSNSILTAESSRRGYLYTQNEIYLSPYDGAKSAAARAIADLHAKAAPYPRFQDLVGRLVAAVDRKLLELDESVAFALRGSEEDALDDFLSNRGKALLDEVTLFTNGIIESADTLIADRVLEQTSNVNLLRWVSLAAAIVVVLVVATTIAALRKNARDIATAHDEVRRSNAGLEARVAERTSALEKALERAELLMAEVNHRVANSLALVASLVRLQAAANKNADVQAALSEIHSRIIAISSVHKRLYQSGDVGFVALDEYLSGLLDGLSDTMRNEGRTGSLTYELAPVNLPTDASVNLGIVVTELVTNAYKYAYPDADGDIRVALRQVAENNYEVLVEDDGVGPHAAAPKGTGLGTRIVRAMAGNLGTEIEYIDRNPGTSARLSLTISQ
jgi:two-component sensor histidine kinase/CHASE3 domain sensor protein